MPEPGPQRASKSASGLTDIRERVLLQYLLEVRHAEGATRIAWSVLIACAISTPFVVGVWLLLDRQLGARFFIVVAVTAAIETSMLLLYRRGLHRPWLDWLNTCIEVSIPAAVLLLDAQRVSPAYALTSAPTLLFLLAVMISSLRLRPALVLLAGALAAAEMLGTFVLLRDRIPADLVARLPSLSAANIVQRCAYVMFAGLVGYWLCRSLLRLVDSAVEHLQREFRIRSAFDRQVTPQVANLLLRDAAGVAAGETRRLTVLFADMRGFTRFAEAREPAEVVAALNASFEVMCDVVERHGGIVNKFLGDGLLALFGVPVGAPDHALRAARSALEMSAEMERARLSSKAPPLAVGVGIHTGEAVAGIVGSRARGEYTVIGDSVNLASRIEGLNKDFGTKILVSEETRDAIGAAAVTRFAGQSQVKGRDRPVMVYELLGLEEGS